MNLCQLTTYYSYYSYFNNARGNCSLHLLDIFLGSIYLCGINTCHHCMLQSVRHSQCSFRHIVYIANCFSRIRSGLFKSALMDTLKWTNANLVFSIFLNKNLIICNSFSTRLLLISKSVKMSHTTPILKSFHWLIINELCTKFSLTYKYVYAVPSTSLSQQSAQSSFWF